MGFRISRQLDSRVIQRHQAWFLVLLFPAYLCLCKQLRTKRGAQLVGSFSVPITIISDVVTKSYTITTSSSNTKITATPPSTLAFRIINAPAFITTAIKISPLQTYTGTGIVKDQQYIVGTDLNTYVGGKIDIINVDRQNYGTIDEVTITWGYVFNFDAPLQFFKKHK